MNNTLLLTIVAASFAVTATAQSGPAKTELDDGQILVGLYTSDDIGGKTVGIGSTDGPVEAGCKVPASYYSGLDHLQVEAIRFGFAPSVNMTVHAVKLYGYTNRSQPTLLGEKSVEKKLGQGWHVVQFDNPITIDASWDGLLPMYEYENSMADWKTCLVSTSFEPRSGNFTAYGMFNTTVNHSVWTEYGAASYGTPCVQMVCSSAPIVEYSIIPDGCESPTVAMGQTFTPAFTISSTSGGEVSSIDCAVTIDGHTTTGTATFTPAIQPGVKQTGTVRCRLTAPESAGEWPMEFCITKVNGEPLAAVASATYSQKVVSRVAPRLSVVEEFTGVECGWCVRGWVGMEKVRNELSDKAAVIAIHQYNSNDAMYGDYYHMASFAGGAPSCKVDRTPRTYNPYSGDGEGIISTVEQFANLLPEVALNVEACYSDAEMNQIEAKATTEFLTDLGGSELVFVLTADGLSGTTPLWMQTNFYSGYDPDYFGLSETKDVELCSFCRGYERGKSKLSLVNNDVMIGSSWPSAMEKNRVPAFGSTKVGSIETSACTLSLPDKPVLLNAIDRDAVFVTAMVIKADGTIANAARQRVASPAGAGSVFAPAAGGTAYDLSGRAASVSSAGLVIREGKKTIR